MLRRLAPRTHNPWIDSLLRDALPNELYLEQPLIPIVEEVEEPLPRLEVERRALPCP
ncbi:MAG: hypothetical protein ABSA11_12165 [Candidatus Bathyarchaeia archaeon]